MNRAIANTACHAINAAVPETAERSRRAARPSAPSCCWPPRAPPTPRSPSQVGCSRPTVILWRQPLRPRWPGRAAAIGPARAGPRPSARGRRAEILAATLSPPPEHLGVTHWSIAAARRPARGQPQHRGTGVGRARPQAVADRDLQVLHRPAAGGQGPRRRRAVPGPARAGHRGLRGRKEPRSRRLPAPPPTCRCARAAPSGAPTTICGTGRPPCSRRWRWPPAG